VSADEQTRVLGDESGPVAATGLADLSGTVLDERYAIKGLVGAGSMGDVYEATQIATGQRVAVKVLKPERAHRSIFYARFMREAKSMQMVQHPGVVHIIDVGQVPGGVVYFAMEFLEGDDLSAVLKREYRMSWPRCRDILSQVADALAAAHARGIVHRDIKPSNCLLLHDNGGSDRVKLLDFGVAKLGVDMVSKELTSAADVVGTVLYMSPEQALGKPADARSDVYAMGVMAYEMATGRVPFPGNDIFKVMSRHLRAAPRPPREVVPDLPEDAANLILKALEKAPEDRFQTMAELRAALDRTMGLASAPAGLSEHVPAPGPGRDLALTTARAGAPLDAHADTMAAPVPGRPRPPETGGFDEEGVTAYFRAPDAPDEPPGQAPAAPHGMLFNDYTQVSSDPPQPFFPRANAGGSGDAPPVPTAAPPHQSSSHFSAVPRSGAHGVPSSGAHAVPAGADEQLGFTERAMPAMSTPSEVNDRPPSRAGLWALLAVLFIVGLGAAFYFTTMQ
jgi:tRNA A-37 threonylcarbamoyl transferase component Bud32